MTIHSKTVNSTDGVPSGRRTALKQIVGVAASALVPGFALAQGSAKFNLKIAITLPESHPTPQALKAACAEILKESNGRLNVEVYPSGQLGSDTDTLSQVRGVSEFLCVRRDCLPMLLGKRISS